MTARDTIQRRRAHVPYAAALLTLSALGACTSGGGATPSTSSTTAGTTTTSAAPSVTTTAAPSPSTSGPNFPAGLPEAAKAHTAKGAEAFVVHYMDQWNKSWTEPNSRLLPPLCDETKAAACASAIKDAKEYESKGWKYDSTPGSVTDVKALAANGATQRVLGKVLQHDTRVIDAKGAIKESYPQKVIPIVFYLSWSTTGWTLSDLRPVA